MGDGVDGAGFQPLVIGQIRFTERGLQIVIIIFGVSVNKINSAGVLIFPD